jgi:hypothetical protein
MRTVPQNKRIRIRWDLHEKLLEDVDYAGDIYLLSQNYKGLSKKIWILQAETATAGLKTHSKETTVLWTNSKIPTNINVNNVVTSRVKQFIHIWECCNGRGRSIPRC